MDMMEETCIARSVIRLELMEHYPEFTGDLNAVAVKNWSPGLCQVE